MSLTVRRAFLAHPKEDEDNDATLDRAALDLRAALEGSGRPALVTLGRDDFRRNAAARSGWGGWPASVAGIANGHPRFDLVVVWPSLTLGRGTFQIVQACARAGRPVVFWDGSAVFVRGVTFRPVTELHETRESVQAWGRIAVPATAEDGL